MPRLLIAASGTGGHIFPALSVAEELPESWDISWLGVPERLENQLVPTKYDMTVIPVGGLQSKGLRKYFQLLKLILAIFFVIYLIKRKQIKLVFTTGGYIAAPAIIASKLCGINVILHESNSYPGKVTRLLGKFCDEVALGLPIAAEKLKRCRTIVTGMPVRKSFSLKNPLPIWVPKGLEPLIVVMGGSQGAVGLNRMVRESLPWLLKQGYRVVHITGKYDKPSNINHKNFVEKSFTEEIPGLLQHADLAISRAGAGALSEFAICSLPVILVPYPYSSDHHQDANAAYAAQFGAALIVHEDRLGTHVLTRALENLLATNRMSSKYKSDDLLNKMRIGMTKLAIKDANQRLISILQRYV
ncbi:MULTISPECIES: undecaprenyldiphospho-muramoylpentapeptide beta-N-acetylglucosaminyltransferase [Prochlorococcus]|uniref:UDP-N-acetylglucosamine--N-acetylmuramyl-(pentapeptide) pyrophosphoryl-undecaprenol N-acetylglucosamine transferase n=1 Tax=Prochlorococcus marinus (strain SARG / CCMP1375 / SS120) TaxID=167539 RepID=MURG_PROMA|nr:MULTISPECIES: undecaprenyldiphospho-muramoylpentapeptide beta-N-acetylglucosaminyltransferase [Prochlorococcus]Q7VDZ2.1 RecName: Full=UDP-N-acetylglucosamine--N-acetylmuramyl-(pentapeptide) pyrophosphoryl-undecaprenol N-acetylglucosamine transferase; AltName: Full=Undecaprenyl-PP-MurNAc-pentapeptide-UDPGlcNAc GlcNAc transferase [Prochlorococcus marinus subsp. marinus str. CCMP1375]AAP99269.1 UDP-N-acetylglucosamine:LPS N-acetylglucosamine transferase [Prochlorococcus marinus subsp. marinus str